MLPTFVRRSTWSRAEAMIEIVGDGHEAPAKCVISAGGQGRHKACEHVSTHVEPFIEDPLEPRQPATAGVGGERLFAYRRANRARTNGEDRYPVRPKLGGDAFTLSRVTAVLATMCWTCTSCLSQHHRSRH